MVELQRPSQAVGNAQPAIPGCHACSEGVWPVDDSSSIVRITRNRLRGKASEVRDVDRDLVEEHSESTSNSGPPVVRWREYKPDAGGDVDSLGQAVTIQTQTEVQGQPRVNLPAVLYEESEIVFRSLRSKTSSVADVAAERIVLAQAR